MMSLAVLVPFRITFPLAILALLGLVIYWFLLRNVPRSRRRLRRANTLVHVVLVFTMLYGLSIVDPDQSQAQFIVTWIGVISLTILTLGLAGADMLNNVRLHVRDLDSRRRARSELLQQADKILEP